MCIREYRIIKKRFKKDSRKNYTEKGQKGKIKVCIEKHTLEKFNELEEEEFVGLSFQISEETHKAGN